VAKDVSSQAALAEGGELDARKSVSASMEAAAMGLLGNVGAHLDILGPVAKRNAQREGGVLIALRHAPVQREQLVTT